MIKMEQPRDPKGKFVLKGEEERRVRTVRLTDTTWNRLGEIAKQRSITRTDVIEELLNQDNKDINKVIEVLKKALTLKANARGAINNKIKDALKILMKQI